jgi:hypothetical protein
MKRGSDVRRGSERRRKRTVDRDLKAGTRMGCVELQVHRDGSVSYDAGRA